MKRLIAHLIAIGSTLAVLASSIAGASEFTCTVCTPPTGVLGYKWFQTRSTSTFICHVDSQTITQSYGGTALVGLRADGSIGAIRFSTSTGGISQFEISGTATCSVNF